MSDKKTLVTTIRTDLKNLATLTRWMHGQGIMPQSRSQALDAGLSALVKLLVKNEPGLEFVSTGSALEYLEQVGLIGTGGGRARRQVALAIQEEERTQVLLPGVAASQTATQQTKQINTMTEAQKVAERIADLERDEALKSGPNLFDTK